MCEGLFSACVMTFCLQGGDLFCLQRAGFILFSEWDCIFCQELEFTLFAVRFILRDEQLFAM